MWLFEFASIAIGIIYVRFQKFGLLFLLYLLIDFSFFNVATYLQYFSNATLGEVKTFTNNTNILISFVELVIYYYYFKIILTSKRTKLTMSILCISFTTLVVLYLTNRLSFPGVSKTYLSYGISAIGLTFLTLPCISYYFQLLRTNSEIDLFNKPSFWIVSGIFFYSILSIPYYLLDNFFNTNKSNYRIMLSAILYYLPFTMNFIFLSKAFVCRRQLLI